MLAPDVIKICEDNKLSERDLQLAFTYSIIKNNGYYDSIRKFAEQIGNKDLKNYDVYLQLALDVVNIRDANDYYFASLYKFLDVVEEMLRDYDMKQYKTLTDILEDIVEREEEYRWD